VILGLSRYGGLRTPSETLSLRWGDIDWELNRMSIPEPKVEHHEGRGIRSCPNFPELRPILDEAFEIFGDKSEYVVAAPQYRAAANTAMGWKNANLLTELRIENGELRIEIHAGRRVTNNSPFSIFHSQFPGYRG
jgi:integrase